MSGLGISDAVRLSIQDWVTLDIVKQIEKALPKDINYVYSKLRESKAWSRKARRKIPTGFERDYICTRIQPLGLVTLVVHTDARDQYIKYITFRVSNKVIAGGFVNVPSVLRSQKDRDRTIKELTFTAEKSVVKFAQFTEKQLQTIQDDLEWGDKYLLNSLNEERNF